MASENRQRSPTAASPQTRCPTTVFGRLVGSILAGVATLNFPDLHILNKLKALGFQVDSEGRYTPSQWAVLRDVATEEYSPEDIDLETQLEHEENMEIT